MASASNGSEVQNSCRLMIKMSKLSQISVRTLAFSALLFCRTKPFTSGILCILTVVLFFYHDCYMYYDPADLRNMKHGFINTIPEHHLNIDVSQLQSGATIKDTLQCAVPPIVHYFWCDKNTFQYQNYLSVLSAYKFLTPTEVIFHYNTLPIRDVQGYYQYYEDLLRDLPNFFAEPIEDQRACSEDSIQAMEYISEMLNQYGGIFLGLNTILSPEGLKYMDNPLSCYHPVDKFASSGALFLSPGALDSVPGTDTKTKFSSSPITCVSSSIYSHKDPCVVVSEQVFPFQIVNMVTDFGELARFIGYGTKEILTAKPQDSLIPNIVHYVWLGEGRRFTFMNFLSLLSSLHVQKAETVYIHGDYEPYGEDWEKAKNIPEVKFISREFPHTVYGNPIRNPSHASDYLRMDILLRYGGVYVDWDLIWVKELSQHQRRHEAIACYDWPAYGDFPAAFNMGIFGAKKESRFVKFAIETFRQYVDTDWGFNAIRMPYKVYEQHPDSLLIDTHLQVICFKGICHPTWLPGYKRDIGSKQDDGPFDWKTQSNAVHWTYPDPEEFADRQRLISSSGMNAEIGQNILHHAGDI